MKLKDYIDKYLVTKSRFARAAGLEFYQVNNAYKGNLPSLPVALKIENATDGVVTVRDFLSDEMKKEIYGDEPPND